MNKLNANEKYRLKASMQNPAPPIHPPGGSTVTATVSDMLLTILIIGLMLAGLYIAAPDVAMQLWAGITELATITVNAIKGA